MAITQKGRKKREAKRLRNKYRHVASNARKGVPGAEDKRQLLDDQLKLIGVRSNA
jgi:hypothetical protein